MECEWGGALWPLFGTWERVGDGHRHTDTDGDATEWQSGDGQRARLGGDPRMRRPVELKSASLQPDTILLLVFRMQKACTAAAGCRCRQQNFLLLVLMGTVRACSAARLLE